MIKSLLTLILSACFFLAFAQKKDTVVYYLTKSNKIVSTKDSADYFAMILPHDTSIDKNLSIIKEYYKNGKIRLIGTLDSKSFKFQGPAMSFFPNGHKMNVKSFGNGQLMGDVIEYYPNGKLYNVKTIVDPGTKNERLQLNECRDSTGNVLAENGNGKWIDFLDETTNGADFSGHYIAGEVIEGMEKGKWQGDLGDSIVILRIYKNGRLISAKDSNISSSTGIYAKGIQAPEFPGGLQYFAKFLGHNIRYPASARDNNTQGRVIISFVIEKDGSLTNVGVVKGIGDGCDEESARVVKLSSPWHPATVDGKPVRTAYSIPIAFTLAQ
jgi:TonB family protein